MFPFSADERFEYEDKSSGLTFLIKPISGANEVEFLTIMEKNKIGEPLKKNIPFLNELFDFLVTGWRGKTVAFPADGHPSVIFNYSLKQRITNAGLQANHLGNEDSKN